MIFFNSLIVTINNYNNYGNRLQNYALSQLLLKSGTQHTIQLIEEKESSASLLMRSFLRRYRQLFLCRLVKNLDWIRFTHSYYFTKKYISKDSLPFLPKHGFLKKVSYGRVVIGSDQVWNYLWLSKEDLALRLGSFVPDDVPVISYAASFGVSDVSDEVKPIFQKYLPRLKAISVREDRGAELVREMTGLDATVVLDPTLMLTADRWKSITRGFVPDCDRYVLTYFLGKPSDAQEQAIQEYAQAHGCRVRRILDLRDEETYVAGPQDFVELFQKAQYVFTDSYHACCFSILFHRQFTVFNRAGTEGKANMNSRMETLFRLFDLDSVVMDKGMAPQIDYEKVDRLFARHRAESRAWLDKAMEA